MAAIVALCYHKIKNTAYTRTHKIPRQRKKIKRLRFYFCLLKEGISEQTWEMSILAVSLQNGRGPLCGLHSMSHADPNIHQANIKGKVALQEDTENDFAFVLNVLKTQF